MFKRFMIGFIVGVCAVYWYIHNGEAFMSNASSWMDRSASAYRNDKPHQVVDQEAGPKSTRR